MELDVSLIEISGEDDSLLQKTPTVGHTTTANCFLPCSPLLIPGSNRPRVSPIVGLKDSVDVEKPKCSAPVGSSNKENVNVNKSEGPKLTVEPQQMKRRKRSGSYNLRKSLAWDRAFFTEEGVLDPLELSILSGSFGNSSREVLPAIHEEETKVSSNSGCAISADVGLSGENLFKENPATSSNKKANANSLLMKHVSSTRDAAAPTFVGTPKMMSNQKGNRTGSKSGGCPRPVVFSSLKRPANASTTKTAMKESKIPKIPASRSGAHSLPKSNKSNVLSASNSKHNQIDQADIFQKSAALQGSFKNIKSSANKAKAGSDSLSSAAKSSQRHPRRNMTNLVLEDQASTNPQSTMVPKANCGLAVFPAGVLPPTGSRAPDAHHASKKTGFLLPQSTQCIDGNIRSTQFQTTKPSGLRMPSPSLGFFGQSKTSASISSSQKATQPRNTLESYIPSLQRLNASNKLRDPRLLHAPGKILKLENNATFSGNVRVSCSSTECFVPCASSDVSHENRRFKLEGNNVHKVEAMIPYYSKRSDSTKENQEVDGGKGFQECGEPHKVEDIKSLEFQNKENVPNVTSNIYKSGGSENLSSNGPPHESPEQAYECAAEVDQLRDKLQVEDVQVHFLGTASLSECCDNKLHTSEVHDQYLVVHDDNKKSGEPLDPQCHCLLIEQTSELNHGSLLHDYLMLSKSTPAEESHGVHGLEIALNVIPVKDDDPGCNLNCSNVLITQGPGVIQDGGADVQDIVEQPQAKKALFTSADIVPVVENHKYYIDTQFRVDLSLGKSRDHTTGTVTTCNPMALCSLIKEEDIGAKGLKKNILAEKAETKVSSDKPLEETQRIKMNGGILFGERRSLGEFHTGDLGSTVDVSLKNQGSAGSELKSCQTASLFKYAKQAKEVAATVDKMRNELCVGDAKVEFLDENLLEGSSSSILSNSAMDSHCLKVVADDGQSGGLPEPQTLSLVVDHVFQEKHGLYLNDHLLLGKSTSSEKLQEEKVLANVQVAHDQSDVDRSESKSSIVVIQVPLSMQDSGVDIESMAEHEHVEDVPLGSVDTETSNEYDKSSIDTLRHDMVFFGQASSESDSVLMMRDNQTFGVSNTGNKFCMSEESVFLDQKEIQANETNIVDIGIDTMNTITPDDIVVKVSQANVGPSGELLHKLENTFCLAEDEDTAMPITKSEDHGKQNSLIIKTPIYAVPFSDEWLAAMEAAGEEILTMKSGAVQNSPPDKSLPEPGPWSPVKRKQNEIGPFDCTKFINIPPSDSS
ncbi:uncharacterized protein LOC130770156 isoform X2 [Actinidia eriantha]|uniref:uncharacterized protein LOC130770156 isoform X2 n=1 Tax=Actinidia eriantha TaxID=165200 RepID=UPI00258A37EE|nr:uncharacterized protein LOC130770156 isoform X2 [Actinidia eriantha]